MNNSLSKIIELVNSLTKSEKRQFKIYTNKYGTKDKDYLQLYNLIEQNHQIDQKKIIEKCKEADINLYLQSNYLYQLLIEAIKSLRKNEENLETIIYDTLEEISILYERNLKSHIKDKIDYIKKIAKDYHLDILLIHIIEIELKLFDGDHSKLEKYFSLQENVKQILTDNIELNNYKILEFEFYKVYNDLNSKTRSIEIKNKIKLKLESHKPTTPRSKLTFNNLNSVLCFYENEYKKTMRYNEEITKIFEGYSSLKQIEFTSYLNHLTNCCYALIGDNDLDNYQIYIEKIIDLSFLPFVLKNERYQALTKSKIEKVQIRKHIMNREDKALCDFCLQINILKLKTHFEIDLLLMINQFSRAAFRLKDWNLCSKIINFLIQQKYPYNHKDILIAAHFQLWTMHYELGNLKLLVNINKDLKRELEDYPHDNFQKIFLMIEGINTKAKETSETIINLKARIAEEISNKDKIFSLSAVLDDWINL